MAIIFQMWIECKDEESTKYMADHFSGVQHKLLNNSTVHWHAEITDLPETPGFL